MTHLKNTLTAFCLSLLLINPVLAHEETPSLYPSYKDGKLTIPRVDTDQQTGNYQDVEMRLNTTTGSWDLINYRETLITPDSMYLNSAEVIKKGDAPVQVFLKVLGDFPSGCDALGQINQRIEGNRFFITMHYASFPIETICTMGFVPFEKIVPLNVYGLAAGTYEYSVNGKLTGSFTLTQDNHLR